MEEPIPVFRGLGYPPTPVSPPPKAGRRAQVIGILHLIFAMIYLSCGGLALLGLVLAPSFGTQLDSTTVVLDGTNTAINALTALALLFAGIMLLRRRALGRQVTIVAAIVIPVLALVYGIVVAVLFTSVDVPTRYRQALEQMRIATLAGACLGTVIRMVYPIVAGAVLLRKPEELGLS